MTPKETDEFKTKLTDPGFQIKLGQALLTDLITLETLQCPTSNK